MPDAWRIYYPIPSLAGRVGQLPRIAAMRSNAVYVNPFQHWRSPLGQTEMEQMGWRRSLGFMGSGSASAGSNSTRNA
jgi:hypothetical protein